MSGTPTLADLGKSLLADCRRRADGSLQYDGKRPGAEWWAHGYLTRRLVVLIDGAPREVTLHKARWLDPTTGRTMHSRPPGELGARRFCALIVFAELYDWLDGTDGVVTRDPVCAPIAPSPRTLQRWLRAALRHALAIQGALRRAVIERAEPQPIEQVFPTGLPPPQRSGRRWANPDLVTSLYRGLALAAAGSRALTTPLAALLAEAHQRFEDTRQPAQNEPTART